jgi:hypothetical protein
VAGRDVAETHRAEEVTKRFHVGVVAFVGSGFESGSLGAAGHPVETAFGEGERCDVLAFDLERGVECFAGRARVVVIGVCEFVDRENASSGVRHDWGPRQWNKIREALKHCQRLKDRKLSNSFCGGGRTGIRYGYCNFLSFC